MNVTGYPSWALNGAALIGAYMLAVSAVAFVVYAADKSAAERGRWRVPERALHLWSLLGGWPGAFLAQRVLRHKTRKEEFLSRYRRTVAAHCGLLALGAVLMGMNLGWSDWQTWPIVTNPGSDAAEDLGPSWLEGAAGALMGAVSITVLRMPYIGHLCLALLAGGALVALTTVGVDGMAALLNRAFAFASRNPPGLAGVLAGQCAAALLGTGTARRT